MTVQRFHAPALLTAAAAVATFWAAPAAAQTTTHAATHHLRGVTKFPAENTPLHFGTTTATHAVAATTSTGSSILRTILGLVIVIALIYAITWVMRRVRKGREGRASGSGLASAATLPLGGGRSLHLVRAGQDVILVGASEHGVTPIRSYTEAEARASGLLADPAALAFEDLDAQPTLTAPQRARPASPAGASVEWRPLSDGPAAGGGVLERLRRLTVRS